MVSPYDYWQFWRNTEDGDVGRFLKLFTIMPLEEIGRLASLKGEEINEAKKVLASEATALVHGRSAADSAAATARATFEENTLSTSLPTIEVPRDELTAGLGVQLAFAEKAKLVASNSDARRYIKDGALRINDRTVTDERMVLSETDLTDDGVIKLSFGKKRHVLLRVTEPQKISTSISDQKPEAPVKLVTKSKQKKSIRAADGPKLKKGTQKVSRKPKGSKKETTKKPKTQDGKSKNKKGKRPLSKPRKRKSGRGPRVKPRRRKTQKAAKK
jgi:hypothetical protein